MLGTEKEIKIVDFYIAYEAAKENNGGGHLKSFNSRLCAHEIGCKIGNPQAKYFLRV